MAIILLIVLSVYAMKKLFLQFGSGLGPMSRSLPIALALADAFEHDNPTIFCYTARFRDNVGESGKKIFEAICDGAKCKYGLQSGKTMI